MVGRLRQPLSAALGERVRNCRGMAKAQVQTLGWNVRSRPARTADHLGLWPRRADTYHPRHGVGQGIRKSRLLCVRNCLTTTPKNFPTL